MIKYKVSMAYNNQEQTEFFDSLDEAKFFLEVLKFSNLLDEFGSFDQSLIKEIEHNIFQIGSCFISLEEVEIKPLVKKYAIYYEGEEILSDLEEGEAAEYVHKMMRTIQNKFSIKPMK